MTKKDVVTKILGRRKPELKATGTAWAPANIALCKYWGKRSEDLNLPVTPSLSISLGPLGARTEIAPRTGTDVVTINGEQWPPDHPAARRAIEYLDLFRPEPGLRFAVRTSTNIPIGAGLASSAAGFAALALALDNLFGWRLPERDLSILARLGSGSAARSVFQGFVHWHAGVTKDGMDSYAESIPITWPELRLGLLVVSDEEKALPSRPAMRQTRDTSTLYGAWPSKVKHDLGLLMNAISYKDFTMLGKTAESNALAMHATMLDSWPPILYWVPGTVRAMHRIWQARAEGLDVYFTMDAGPNLKLLFQAEDTAVVKEAFPDVQVVDPFRFETMRR
ncbi:MAG: diphosphomevalonate decarboxylase [Kiritimatiellae bacterium]|nr:diphosphomevalonate decarboxylase [Kiritimatiellia bacterium]